MAAMPSALRSSFLPAGAVSALVVSCAALAAGCGGGAKSAGNLPTRFVHASFDPANFGSPTTGANKWLPLKPGTQRVTIGTKRVGHRTVPHRVVSTVTDVVRRVDGVRAVALLDQSLAAGQIFQQSLDWLAQDKLGNVWFLGSYTEHYEGGRFSVIKDAWLSGLKGGKPGILMPADPTTRTPPWTIAQPPGADPDAAEVVQTGQSQCVPYNCFKDVLVVREGKESAIDNEFKYYAPGVGQIINTPHIASFHKDTDKLVNVIRLSGAGLAEFSAEALRMDRHARVTAPDVFTRVPAAKRAG
jgi:hypothetical protein